jgi:hypothetical protein
MMQQKQKNPQQLYVAISETIPKHIPGTVIPNDGQGRPLHVLRIQSKPARLEIVMSLVESCVKNVGKEWNFYLEEYPPDQITGILTVETNSPGRSTSPRF